MKDKHCGEMKKRRSKREARATSPPTGTNEAADECVDGSGSGWKYNNHTKKCYKLFQEPMGWTSAVFSCRFNAPGGLLASVPDRETEEFLMELAKSSVEFSGTIWLGGYLDGGKWQWEDGTPWNYTNWAPFLQPNNVDGIQNRLKMRWWEEQSWNDDAVSAKHRYICQYQSE